MSADNEFKPTNPKLQKFAASLFAVSIFVAQVTPALATIDNTATAAGTYNSTAVTSPSSTVNVPVAAAVGAISITKTAGTPTTSNGTDPAIVDAGDTITYTYTVKNSGNVTLTSVTPTDVGPTFNSAAGTGTLGAFSPAPVTLAPGATQIFTATYTMSQLDVDRAAGQTNAVSNTAAATGKTPTGTTVTATAASTATVSIPAAPKLQIVKTFALADVPGGTANKADVGEVITYTYTVTNIGNVAMTNVSINDVHAGTPIPAGTIKSETLVTDGPLAGATPALTSTDATNDGKWDLLQPGATIKFTLQHTVTQAEVDAG